MDIKIFIQKVSMDKIEKQECDIIVRSIEIPNYKLEKIKRNWIQIYTAIIEYGKLQIRFNPINKTIDVRNCRETVDLGYLDRSLIFISAILEGFKVEDSISILKYKDVFIDKFDINEVRKLRPNHMSRAIGRIIGRNGKIKETIEHFSKCKFLLINQRIVLLGCIENIKVARDAICRLIQGSEPNSIFNILKIKSTKLKEKYGELQIIYEDLKKC